MAKEVLLRTARWPCLPASTRAAGVGLAGLTKTKDSGISAGGTDERTRLIPRCQAILL